MTGDGSLKCHMGRPPTLAYAAADLPPIRLHDLRHGAATLALAEAAVAMVLRRAAKSANPTARPAAPAPPRPHQSLKDDSALPPQGRKRRSERVRRQGLEPRTRGLRVRCSAS